jgi:hypothetical protein
MADDREMVLRFLDMVRGSLDEKNRRLLEELRLVRPIALGRPDGDQARLATLSFENDPDYEHPKRKTARDAVAPSPGPLIGRARSVA